MQRKWIVVTILLMCAGLVFAGMEKEVPNPWVVLKEKGVMSLQVTPVKGEKQVVVELTPIRAALEDAGLNEKVMVYLSIGGREVGCLGKFTPQVADDGNHGDGKANPSLVRFPTIPKLKNMHLKWDPDDNDAGLARPARPATVVRPARPATVMRPARPARPATVMRPARPARPARIRMPAPDPLFGILTFRNAEGRTMLHMQVKIIGM
ncbi:MAG TPA: hypothetical protein ENN40_04425 [Candidatus Aminicenantes bacterium]|nr:hypothetical protein [Candidatus Aminicenantes bacterium]